MISNPVAVPKLQDEELETSPEIQLPPSSITASRSATTTTEMATSLPRKLWEHPDPESTEMYRFMQEANKRYSLKLKVSSPR